MVHSDEVISNLGYALMWIPYALWHSWASATVIAVAGLVLAVTSSGFHHTRSRTWQKLDIWGVFVVFGAVTAVLLGQLWAPAHLFIFAVALGYWPMRESIDSTSHFIGWGLVTIVLVVILTEAWAALPLSFFGIAIAAKGWERIDQTVDTHGVVHSWGWHVPLALAVMSLAASLHYA